MAASISSPISRFVPSTGVALVVALLLGCGPEPTEREPSEALDRPHILLISLDTLRADHLGAWDYDRPTSPFLDRLASRGIRFSHAFVNTHGTPPSHATLFTSLHQKTHGVSIRRRKDGGRDHVLPQDLTTLPEILRQHGYRTVAVTSGGFMGERHGFDRGFETYLSRPFNVGRVAGTFRRQLRTMVKEDGPIFAFFHTYEIHTPYDSPSDVGEPFGEFESELDPTSEALRAYQASAAKELTRSDFDFLEAAYDRGIRYTDEVLRELFADLEESGFLSRAVVFITSDHGEEFGEHGGLMHRGTLYEELIHVPLIVQGTGIESGVVDSRLVSTIDVAPTILGLAGIDTPAGMEGADLLRDPTRWEADDAVFSQYGSDLRSIRTSRFKLIANPKRAILYDLKADPTERRNVAKIHPEVTRRLHRRLALWYDALPTFDPSPAGDELDLSEQELEELRHLGYVD